MTSKNKRKAYLQRKKKTNTIIKSQLPSYRCVVVRSLKHIRAQIVDNNGNTVAAASDLKMTSATKTEKAQNVGKDLAKVALDKGIKSCVFDRNGFLYHGRVKALCEGLREGGVVV